MHKAIYGLKQAPRAWHAQLSLWLIGYGFRSSRVDSSLFIYNQSDIHIYLLVYVDDIVITSSHTSTTYKLISELGVAFPVKDLGRLSFFLGLELEYLPTGVLLSQRKYIKDLLSRSQMLHAKPVTLPITASLKLSTLDSPTFDDPHQYRSIVDALQYLSLTRPNISFSMNKVCQFIHNSKQPHWTAVKRILTYLKNTINHSLFFSSNSSL